MLWTCSSRWACSSAVAINWSARSATVILFSSVIRSPNRRRPPLRWRWAARRRSSFSRSCVLWGTRITRDWTPSRRSSLFIGRFETNWTVFAISARGTDTGALKIPSERSWGKGSRCPSFSSVGRSPPWSRRWTLRTWWSLSRTAILPSIPVLSLIRRLIFSATWISLAAWRCRTTLLRSLSEGRGRRRERRGNEKIYWF